MEVRPRPPSCVLGDKVRAATARRTADRIGSYILRGMGRRPLDRPSVSLKQTNDFSFDTPEPTARRHALPQEGIHVNAEIRLKKPRHRLPQVYPVRHPEPTARRLHLTFAMEVAAWEMAGWICPGDMQYIEAAW